MALFKRCIFTTQEPGAEIIIGNNCGGTGLTIAACSTVTIGNNVLMGAYSSIIDNDFHNPDPSKREGRDFDAKPIVIEDNVFIGMNVLILKGVRIGKNAVIGANSVVLTSIPENAVAMGNPCKVIIKRNWGAQEKPEEKESTS
jgi:acetyltransferase-like isoleucine patch superfamily enzyme